MKILLLIFILSLNVLAQWKADIIPNDTSESKLTLQEDTREALDISLLKWVENQKVYKGEWSEDAIGSIVSKKEIKIKTLIDKETKKEEIVEEEVFLHFKPTNFSVEFEDLTTTIQEQKAKEARKKELKDKQNSGIDLSLEELNELMRD